jgi:hypothetical protein
MEPQRRARNAVYHFRAATKGEPVDFWNDMRWDPPGAFYLEVGVTKPGRPREEGSFMGSVHILTPETEASTVAGCCFETLPWIART